MKDVWVCDDAQIKQWKRRGDFDQNRGRTVRYVTQG